MSLGAPATANERSLCQYLHPDVLPTCQLLMGMTRLANGSVWNTMPAHTHDRRMEAYLCFDIAPEAFVLHLMGRPEAARHLVVRDEQAVLSTPWSQHCGAGTGANSLVWSMVPLGQYHRGAQGLHADGRHVRNCPAQFRR